MFGCITGLWLQITLTLSEIELTHGQNLLNGHNFSVSRHFVGFKIAHSLISINYLELPLEAFQI